MIERTWRNRILFFDILRIFAIFLVVLSHIIQFGGVPYLRDFYGIPGFYWVSLGGIGVTIFLVVSGSSLALNYASFHNLDEIKRFYINRIIRIYPAYCLAVILTILLFIICIPGYAKTLTITTLLLTFSGLYSLLGQWGGPIMSIGWFIGLIMILYAVYPLLIWAFNENLEGTILFLLFISIASRIVCGYLQTMGLGVRLIDWVPLCRVFEFGLGIYLVKAGLYIKTIHLPDYLSRIILFASIFSFPVFLIHYPFFENGAIYKALKFNSQVLPVVLLFFYSRCYLGSCLCNLFC